MPLLLQITIFLGASLLLVPLLKRLGIATVLGYLFTGILLGPSVLNIASDPEAIQELAEFGVILLMFIIGLELRPQRLWQMRQSIFGMGSLQVGITGLVLAVISFFALQQGIATSFVIGFTLALSSTAFVLQLLAEKQQLNTTYGQQSFSILLFQDMAAIPLIAVIPYWQELSLPIMVLPILQQLLPPLLAYFYSVATSCAPSFALLRKVEPMN